MKKRIGLLLVVLMLMLPSLSFAVLTRAGGTTYFQTRSASKLSLPSDKLDKEFNDIVDYVNGMSLTTNASEWSLHATAPTYVNSTSFYVTGDVTATFAQYRRIEANLTGSYVYTTISSSSYNGGTNRTTVVVADAVLTAALSEIYYGIINSTSATNSLPTTINATTINTTTINTTKVNDFPVGVVALSDAATISVNASLGDIFYCSSSTDRTLGIPSGSPSNGQKMLLRWKNTDTVSHILTLTTGSSGAYAYGGDITATIATAAGKTDYFSFIYDSTAARWHLIGYVKGY